MRTSASHKVVEDWGGEALVAERDAVHGGAGQFTEGHVDGLRREGEGSDETTHGWASWQDLENALLGVQQDRTPLVEGRSAGVEDCSPWPSKQGFLASPCCYGTSEMPPE